MKRIIVLLTVLICGLAGTADAEPFYVTDTLKVVTMRTGPGKDHKILVMLKIGQPLEIIEKGDEWSKVRLGDDKEGWTMTRFLTPQTPASLQLAALKRRYDALSNRASKGSVQTQSLAEENKTLQVQLTKTTKELETTVSDYDSLRRSSANVLKIKADRDRLAKETKSQSQLIAQLKTDLDKARSNQNFWWFLGGASVFLVGLVFGLALRSQRRRPSLY